MNVCKGKTGQEKCNFFFAEIFRKPGGKVHNCWKSTILRFSKWSLYFEVESYSSKNKSSFNLYSSLKYNILICAHTDTDFR